MLVFLWKAFILLIRQHFWFQLLSFALCCAKNQSQQDPRIQHGTTLTVSSRHVNKCRKQHARYTKEPLTRYSRVTVQYGGNHFCFSVSTPRFRPIHCRFATVNLIIFDRLLDIQTKILRATRYLLSCKQTYRVSRPPSDNYRRGSTLKRQLLLNLYANYIFTVKAWLIVQRYLLPKPLLYRNGYVPPYDNKLLHNLLVFSDYPGINGYIWDSVYYW